MPKPEAIPESAGVLVGTLETLSTRLSGTESAILNRESGDSESCDWNRAIPGHFKH